MSILVAVDETLACERLSNLGKHTQLNIMYYRDKVPLAPVLRYLQDAFGEVYSKQRGFLKNLRVVFTEPFVEFEEFAARIGVSAEAVRAALTEKPPDSYIVLPNGLIKKDKFEQIREKIDEQIGKSGALPLPEAARIIEKEGVDVTSVIEALGYKIVWHGINTEKAEAVKSQSKGN